jgi:hypothetical protein
MKIVLYLACTLAGIILVQACCHPNNEMSVSVTNESSQSFYLEQWRKGDTSLSRGYHTVNFVTYRQVISILEKGWGDDMSYCENIIPQLDSLVVDLESDSLKIKFDLNDCENWKYSETTDGRCGTTRGRWYLTIEDSDFETVE